MNNKQFKKGDISREAYDVIMHDLQSLDLRADLNNNYHYQLLKGNLNDIFGINDTPPTVTDWEELPEEVQDILASENPDEDEYKELSRIENELKEIGWYMDYYLDGDINELRPMTQEEITQYNNDKIEREARGKK